MESYMPISKPHLSSMHKSSHIITKDKPKIRIIHIFAPEIIKTDVANFRELVQRLTGKPTHQDLQKKRPPRHHHHHKSSPQQEETREKPKPIILANINNNHVIKEEDMIWNNGANSGGFLNGFGDFDGFIQELGGGDDFSFFPLHAFEETQLA